MERFGAGELAYMLDLTVAPGSVAASWLADTGEAIVESLSQDKDLWEYPAGRGEAVDRARIEAVSGELAPGLAWQVVGELGAWRRVEWEALAPTGTHWDGRAGLMLPPDPKHLAGLMLVNVAETLIPQILAELIEQRGEDEDDADGS